MAINTKQIEEMAKQIEGTDDCEALRLLADEHLKSINKLIKSTVRTQADQMAKFIPLLKLPGPNPVKIVKWIKKHVIGQAMPQLEAYIAYAKDLIELAEAVETIAGAVKQADDRMKECYLEQVKNSALDTLQEEVSASLDVAFLQIGETQITVTEALDIAPTIDLSSRSSFTQSVDTGLSTLQDHTSTLMTAPKLESTALPEITGELTEGSVVSVSNGQWNGADTATYTYQWYRVAGGASLSIDDATSNTYTLTAFDTGCQIKCTVHVENTGDAESATSSLFGPVVAQPQQLV